MCPCSYKIFVYVFNITCFQFGDYSHVLVFFTSMQIGLACIGVVAGAADNSQAKITFEVYDNDYCIFDCLLDCNAPETIGKAISIIC